MKEKLERIENEILILGRTNELEKEEKLLLVEFYNIISQEDQLWR